MKFNIGDIIVGTERCNGYYQYTKEGVKCRVLRYRPSDFYGANIMKVEILDDPYKGQIYYVEENYFTILESVGLIFDSEIFPKLTYIG